MAWSMWDQRGANAAVAAPAKDARSVGLETALLELPELSHGPASATDAVGLLEMSLPTSDWWGLLRLTPKQLHQQLSAPGVAA
jgi:hypothetical protein